jgi:ketosteroid isomerase-like protein
MSEQDNAELVLELIKAVEERDAERLFANYHDDVEFHDASSLPYGGTYRGKAEIVARFEEDPEGSWLGTWGPLQPTDSERRMDARIVAASGDEIVALYHQRAVGPDGERFEKPCVGLYRIRDGKLARAQMFHYDKAAISEFLQRAQAASAQKRRR